MSFSAKSEFRMKKDNLFYPLLLLLSEDGDVSLNLQPLVTLSCSNKEWQASNNSVLLLIHLNINSLQPKID